MSQSGKVRTSFSGLVLWQSVVVVASLRRGQFAWWPLYDSQLSGGQFAAVSCPCLKLINLLCDQAVEAIETNYKNELASLRAQVVELQQNQEFICSQFDVIKGESEQLKIVKEDLYAKNKVQAEELKVLRENSNDSEDVANSGVKLSNLARANVKKTDISTAHCLPPKHYSKVSTPPAIIVRLIIRNVRNEVYSKRTAVKKIVENDLPVTGMEIKNIFINKNLTRNRKQQLWKTRQAAKKRILLLYGPIMENFL